MADAGGRERVGRGRADHIAVSEDVEGAFDDPDDAEVVGFGFSRPVEPWRALGAIDANDTLTALGWWGLPEALGRAWSPSRPGEP